jgi:hypothetical protein
VSVEGVHHFYVDNEQTNGHVSLVYGIREPNSSESDDLCLLGRSSGQVPIFNATMVFSEKFEMRNYLSGCYYMNAKKE